MRNFQGMIMFEIAHVYEFTHVCHILSLF